MGYVKEIDLRDLFKAFSGFGVDTCDWFCSDTDCVDSCGRCGYCDCPDGLKELSDEEVLKNYYKEVYGLAY